MFNWLFRQDTDQLTKLADQIGEAVQSRIANKLVDEFAAIAEVESATQRVVELTKDLAALKAEKENIEEGFRRKEREVEHKVGLLRTEIEAGDKQREQDFHLRVQEAKLVARETGLVEREKAFTERMDFMTKRFTEEVGYLKDMVKQVLARLPDAAILGTKQL